MDQVEYKELLARVAAKRKARIVYVSDSETARVVDSAVRKPDGSATPLSTAGGRTYHTAATLRAAALVEPSSSAVAAGLELVEVKVRPSRQARLRVLFYAPPDQVGIDPGAARCRCAHHVHEIDGFLVEVVTSTAWCTIILGNHTDVHSLPHINPPADGFGVLKLVPCVQAGAVKLLSHAELVTVPAVRKAFNAAKERELAAVEALKTQGLRDAVTREAKGWARGYDERDVAGVVAAFAAASISTVEGEKLETHERSNYLPLGWDWQPHGEKKAAWARFVKVAPPGVDALATLYLHTSTFDEARGEVKPSIASVSCATAGMLGHAASLLANAWPDALRAAHKAAGGVANATKFTYPPAAVQAARGASGSPRPWLAAWHATQICVHWAGAPVHGMEKQKPTARHRGTGVDSGNARSRLALPSEMIICIPHCTKWLRSAQRKGRDADCVIID